MNLLNGYKKILTITILTTVLLFAPSVSFCKKNKNKQPVQEQQVEEQVSQEKEQQTVNGDTDKEQAQSNNSMIDETDEQFK